MHLSYLSAAFAVAGLALAVPSPSLGESQDVEHEVFKRGAPLTARDLELADMHSVNLTEMYKHSVQKRDDGDHYTVWVHNSYADPDDADDSSALEKRAGVRTFGFHSTSTGTRCDTFRTYNSKTGPNAPFLGGIDAIIRWGQNNRGEWHYFNAPAGTTMRNLIVAGSNSGFNARFSAKLLRENHDGGVVVGAHDVRDITSEARRRYAKNVGGGWRLRAWGNMSCRGYLDQGGIALMWKEFRWTIERSTVQV